MEIVFLITISILLIAIFNILHVLNKNYISILEQFALQNEVNKYMVEINKGNAQCLKSISECNLKIADQMVKQALEQINKNSYAKL